MTDETINAKILSVASFDVPGKGPELRADDNYFTLPYFVEIGSFRDEETWKRLVKGVEKQVRTAPEYEVFLAALRSEVGLDRCAFLGNVEDDDATLEFHHYPLTLWEVVEVVVEHMVESGERVSSFRAAAEVLRAHADGLVSGAVVSKTAHELAHAGKLFIHKDQVWGDVSGFLDRYSLGVGPGHVDAVNALVEASERWGLQSGALRSGRGVFAKAPAATSVDAARAAVGG
jgi:hypothetical protein